MRVTIFVISGLFSLLVAFCFMSGDYQYMIYEFGAVSFLLCAVASIFFLLAFKFVKKKAGVMKIWQRAVLLILILLNLSFWSILISLINASRTMFRWLSETHIIARNMYKGETMLFTTGFVISLIIFLPPFLYLIKQRKEIKPEG